MATLSICHILTTSSTTTTTTTNRHHVPSTLGRSSTCPFVVGYSITTRPVLTTRRSTYMNTRPMCSTNSTSFTQPKTEVKRSDFPQDFVFGAGSAAYQIEGAANEGGKGPSIWDTLTHQCPENISDASTGDTANDSYHLYKEDVRIIKNMGLDAYRISISWSRILPTGKLSGGVNREGIEYYNNLINELLANGIEPYVTLFHWDLPQALQDKYGGFSSEDIVADFCDYANLCFWEFGNRVKNWITLNEPWSYSIYGNYQCTMAPGGLYPWYLKTRILNMYDVAHNLLLAHANAVALYKKNYQTVQKGKIGIVNVACWFKSVPGHGDVGERETDFQFGWFMDPLTKGEYPKSMIERVPNLKKFSVDEQTMLKNSFDFIGLNYYTAYYVIDQEKYTKPQNEIQNLDYEEPFVCHPLSGTLISGWWDGRLIGEKASSWLHVCPEGLGHVLTYIKEKYNNPLIYVSENGVNDKSNCTLFSEVRNDFLRQIYIQNHLRQVIQARKDKVNVMGYFVWSLMDNFEWCDGYLSRFGLIYVDYNNNLTRLPKDSALWLMNFLKGEKSIEKTPLPATKSEKTIEETPFLAKRR